MINAVVYEPDMRIASILEEILEAAPSIGPVEHAPGWSDVRRWCALNMRTVVVLGPETAEDDLQNVLKITADYPGTAFVYVVDELDAQTLQRAMRHGIKDVIAVAEAGIDLPPAVMRAHAMVESQMGSRTPRHPSDGPKGKVVTVIGPKGGAGKTMVATNLAVLSARAGVSTVLFDASLRFGDCAAVLRVRPERSIADLSGLTNVPDEAILSGVLTTHESGIKVLCAPSDPLTAEDIDSNMVAKVIEGLRQRFDLVVIDTAPGFDSHIVAALGVSDLVYLVTSLELPAVKDAKQALTMIEHLNLGDDKVKVILNRANSRVGFPPDEVARALGRGAAFELPSDVAVPRSLNNGVPVASGSPKAKVSKGLEQVAADMKTDLFGGGRSGRRSVLKAVRARAVES